jgi:dihydropteroate synthase
MASLAAAQRRVAVPGSTEWWLRDQRLSLREPLIVGILNVTPDSFSDGGRYLSVAAAVERADQLQREGARLLDIGGESTRPGAVAVAADEEISRVVPIIEAVRRRVEIPISVDTRKAEVARAALEAGAQVVNDVSGLRDPGMAAVVAEAGAGLVLMHMRGTPETMQVAPSYSDVVGEVVVELARSVELARAAGVATHRIAVDPGIGFGKTAEHNLLLIRRLDVLGGLGYPVMLGVSRKAFIGALVGGAPPEERALGTAAACVVGLMNGARIFRVHDVRVAREALSVAEAIRAAS